MYANGILRTGWATRRVLVEGGGAAETDPLAVGVVPSKIVYLAVVRKFQGCLFSFLEVVVEEEEGV